MSERLFDKLVEYSRSDIYPFCMPGHKRNQTFPVCIDPYQIDITEVEGFDDLHRANGILKAITERAGEIYQGPDQRTNAQEAGQRNDAASTVVRPSVFMSVNGSTACNLAAVNAVPDGPVLIAANCHRSVFNGARISGKQVIELAPTWISQLAVYGGIGPEDVERALRGYPEIKAVVITSPSYEGFVSDVEKIAEVVHAHGAYLIVDEAHGAHLPFCDALPVSAIYLGADIVIHSLHKTVGSLNQTALAFVNAPELEREFHEKLLLFTTTSPSYILMASIEQTVLWAGNHRSRFSDYCQRLSAFRDRLTFLTDGRRICSNTEGIPRLSLPPGGSVLVDKSIVGSYNIFDLDEAKLMFAVRGMSGETLYRKFYEEHRLQFEKYGDRYALAMTTVWDTDEGFERLFAACEKIHAEVRACAKKTV